MNSSHRRLIASTALTTLAAIVVALGRPVPVHGNAGQTILASSPSELREWDPAVTRMSRNGSLRLRDSRPDPLVPGSTHERFAQYHQGMRVFGGDVLRQRKGTTTASVFGQMYEEITVDSSPVLSPEEAESAAIRSRPGAIVQQRATELVVLPLDGGRYARAYRVGINTATDRTVSFVDAATGTVLLAYSNLQRQAAVGRGTGVFGEPEKVSATKRSDAFFAKDSLRPPDITTFDMHGNVSRTLDFLNGSIDLGARDQASTTSNTWTDGPSVNAHVYAGFTYDYYFKRFGRRGLDNRDLPMTIIVHPASRADIATASDDVIDLFYLNAFYAGDGTVVYGEGLPPGFVLSGTRQTVDFFAAGLDVVAHELSHGVTEFTSGLIYQNESGALNEAFSDVMGLSVKFFFRPTGTALMQANYEVGADVFRPGGIRSFDNPAAFGDPDHYSKRYVGSDDNGGVHTNCTIVDHAFYLAVEGGTNRTSGLRVDGVGAANREQMEKIFYRGFTLMLPPNATFSMARAATIQSAQDLYGASSPAARAITQAWTAVGVN